jgi:hypothetical protein
LYQKYSNNNRKLASEQADSQESKEPDYDEKHTSNRQVEKQEEDTGGTTEE